ncbi:lipoate--protein ligase family protein [Acidiferrobacter sp.]|uniref:lipoate--protein ligase family protein n=1 Tax=Acidiferrobacter sp. TaxID=1872107 RepID=UPI0026212A0E|nr:lipoate--protein ligase family protein [Acidiferrobacter sp.]
MQLFEPSDNSGLLPIAYFHALARLGAEGLILIEPARSFVSLGTFDDAATTVDRDYCRDHGIPVMRRETGGGMVLLGPGQIFYTLVLKRPHALVPSRVDDAYRHLSQAPIEVYRRFGVAARLRPINDIVTAAGRKIGGQGAGDIHGHFCFVGSILVDFDTDLMQRIVRLPDEGLRPALKTALEEGLSCVHAETGSRPSAQAVKAALAEAFAPLVGGLQPRPVPACLMARAREVAQELSSAGVVDGEETRPRPLFKVHEGLYLCQRAIAAPGGTITVSLDIRDQRIAAASLLPAPGATGLDLSALIGRSFDREALTLALPDVSALGLDREDFIAALLAPGR